MASYLAACEEQLGTWPDLDCQRDGVEVPITVTDVDGVHLVTHTSELQDGTRCDRSSVGGCAPGTKIGVVQTDRGAFVTFGCRSYGDSPGFDQINVIATHPETGATCFFSTKHIDDRYRDGTSIPRPGSPEDITYDDAGRPFWYTLEDLQGSPCLSCHDNDPYLRNPWIDQTGVLPVVNPTGPYWLVAHEVLELGDPLWAPPRMMVHEETAACRSCHRIADRRSCILALEATGRQPRGLTSDFYQQTWPYNRWMPAFHEDLLPEFPTEADWEAAFGETADAVAVCCGEDPPEGCFAE